MASDFGEVAFVPVCAGGRADQSGVDQLHGRIIHVAQGGHDVGQPVLDRKFRHRARGELVIDGLILLIRSHCHFVVVPFVAACFGRGESPVSDVIIYPNKKGLEKEMGFSVGEFTHFDCGDIKYETYAGVVAILQEEAVLNNWMRVTFYKTRESYDIINRYLIKARSYVYNNENVSKNLNEEINGVDVLIRGGDKKKEDDYVMSASWTANGFNYVVYAEKYVHMDELKQLVVDVMESEEYKAGK